MIWPTVVAAVIAAVAFLGLRLAPIWHQRKQGCDAFNILLCAEALRRDRRLPPHIPDLFILEDARQWYPPAFLVLCAAVPQAWLKQCYWLFNQLVDVANAGILFGVVVFYTHSAWLSVGAVLIYAICSGLVLEFAALTTRPLGLLVVNLLIFSGVLTMHHASWAIVCIVCGVLLVYSHKLSAQLVWLAAPSIFIATGHWVWASMVPSMYLFAFIVWPKGFREIIRGHIAIVRFWGRNWPLLGAHAVRQSPIYGKGSVERWDYYSKWPKGAPIRFLKEILHQNYFILPVATGISGHLLMSEAQPWEHTNILLLLVAWISAAYAMAVLTHFMPALRGIGLGLQYIKFALLPCLGATSILLAQTGSFPIILVAILALLLAIRQYVLVMRRLWRSRENIVGDGVSGELLQILEHIKADEHARTMVLPVQLCDLVAYWARRPVYWGTHGQCFDSRLQQFFPVLCQTLSFFATDGNLTRLLLDTRYVAQTELGLSDEDLILQAGPYKLYRLAEVSSSDNQAVNKQIGRA